MADSSSLTNRLRELRDRHGWSQGEVARRAGLSRAGVGAIETGRIIPSTAAALALASAFNCRVEDLFALSRDASLGEVSWAWPPPHSSCRYWLADLGGRTRAYPVEAPSGLALSHDGVAQDGEPRRPDTMDPRRTLVLACCDPAAGLLAAEYARETGYRLLVLPRSSGQSLKLLEQGLVHVAGVHLATVEEPEANRLALGAPPSEAMCLLRVARWEEGLALGGGVAARSVEAVLRSKLSWVGREPGSGARKCLDQLRPNHPPPRRLAYDHRGVAEAIRSGWAEVGVCLRLASEDARLDFLGIRHEFYDLCYPARIASDPRIEALVRVVRSPLYRTMIAELPGYDASDTGQIDHLEGPCPPRAGDKRP